MTWVIGSDGNVDIVGVVQDHPVPIAPTPAMTSLIPAPHRCVRRSISNDDLIISIDQVTDRLAECQLLVDSVLDQSRASDEFPVLQDHQVSRTNTRVSKEKELMTINIDSSKQSRARLNFQPTPRCASSASPDL